MRRPIAGLVLVIAVLAAGQAPAETPEDFYRGKRLTLTVGYGPGGGYDVFARLLARHIGRLIPGNPQIIVQNTPAAGSLIAANYLYSAAAEGGTPSAWLGRNMQALARTGPDDNSESC